MATFSVSLCDLALVGTDDCVDIFDSHVPLTCKSPENRIGTLLKHGFCPGGVSRFESSANPTNGVSLREPGARRNSKDRRTQIPESVQCSVSFNTRKGTLRGMHYQAAPFAETQSCSLHAGRDLRCRARLASALADIQAVDRRRS